jgi:hypothetical protein
MKPIEKSVLGEEGIEPIKSMKCEHMKIIGDETSFIPSFASLFPTCDNNFIAAVLSSHDLSSQKLRHTNFFHTSFLQGAFFLELL